MAFPPFAMHCIVIIAFFRSFVKKKKSNQIAERAIRHEIKWRPSNLERVPFLRGGRLVCSCRGLSKYHV